MDAGVPDETYAHHHDRYRLCAAPLDIEKRTSKDVNAQTPHAATSITSVLVARARQGSETSGSRGSGRGEKSRPELGGLLVVESLLEGQ